MAKYYLVYVSPTGEVTPVSGDIPADALAEVKKIAKQPLIKPGEPGYIPGGSPGSHYEGYYAIEPNEGGVTMTRETSPKDFFKPMYVPQSRTGPKLTPAGWLPKTTPGIVSRTADGAYGKYLKTRTPHPEPQGIPIEGFGNYGIPPTKRHIPRFFGDGSLRDWQGQDWLARMQQLLDNLPAPFKNWLSNYPRLPQSTIPTPKGKYPAPGRPPIPETPYNNPFAWRRKNNGWW